jgi:hypothetical protein
VGESLNSTYERSEQLREKARLFDEEGQQPDDRDGTPAVLPRRGQHLGERPCDWVQSPYAFVAQQGAFAGSLSLLAQRRPAHA